MKIIWGKSEFASGTTLENVSQSRAASDTSSNRDEREEATIRIAIDGVLVAHDAVDVPDRVLELGGRGVVDEVRGERRHDPMLIDRTDPVNWA